MDIVDFPADDVGQRLYHVQPLHDYIITIARTNPERANRKQRWAPTAKHRPQNRSPDVNQSRNCSLGSPSHAPDHLVHGAGSESQQ